MNRCHICRGESNPVEFVIEFDRALFHRVIVGVCAFHLDAGIRAACMMDSKGRPTVHQRVDELEAALNEEHSR